MRFQTGQNLTEYSLVLAAVSVAAIVALTSMGSNVSDMFSNMITHRSASSAQPPAGGGTPTSGGGLALSPFANLPGKNIVVDLGDGTKVNYFMANPEAVAEAAGGNGVTGNALAALDQVIAQLKEQGQSETSIAELEALSRKGHDIQALQKLIEDNFPERDFASFDERRYAFSTTTVEMPDKTQSNVYELAKSLSDIIHPDDNYYSYHGQLYNEGTNHDFAFQRFDKSWNTGNLLTDFRNQLQRVEDLGILNNSTLKSLIKDDLSRQIFLSSQQTLFAPTKEDVKNYVGITKMSSNGICQVANSVTCIDKG